MPQPTAGNDPVHSSAFGPIEDADATRQAQHSRSNDSPTDVNNNAALARVQAQTTALIGAEFEAAAARRTIFADKDVKPT